MSLSVATYGSSSTTNNTTLNVGGITASVGDRVIVVICGNASNGTSVSDAAGNSYSSLFALSDATGNIRSAAYQTTVTSALSGVGVTITFGTSVRHKSAVVFVARPTSGSTSIVETGTGTIDASGGSISRTTVASVPAGATVLFHAAHEGSASVTGDSDTTNGTWSSVGRYGSTRTSYAQAKITTGVGTQTWNVSGDTGRAITSYFIVKEVVATGYTIEPETGTYEVTGQDATLAYGRIFAADTTSYSITGTAASFVHVKGVPADSGNYSFTGTSAGLIVAGAPTGLTFSASGGTYTVTGTAVTFKQTYINAASTASYSITGTAADIYKGQTLVAASTSYSVTGSTAGFLYSRVVEAGQDSYTISGTQNNFLYGRSVVAATASYAVTGTAATFQKGQRRVDNDGGVYTISGKRVALFNYPGSGYVLRNPDPGIKFWSNKDGLVVSYPRYISFFEYIRRPSNINGNGNVMVTTDAGTGLFNGYGHLRINLVDGTQYTGIFTSDGAVNALLIDTNDEEPDQLFHSSGALRIVEAAPDEVGTYNPRNGAMYVVNIR